MQLYNSLTTKEFKLEKNSSISIYNCGPTVYNHVHIGNVRPLVTFDVLYRLLSHLGFSVKYFHNITDIDDKIINKALEQNKTEVEISSKYYQAYLKVLKDLNILKMEMPKVSDHILNIIDYIQLLIDNHHAYVTPQGNVYFDIRSIDGYGNLSNQRIDALNKGVRKENLADKHFELDFNLWKKTNVGISWKSPWSKGRPGWHTECACLINKYIGDHVTIHGGGIDLKFPHHENENIQNIALNHRSIADCWMHIGHVNVNHEKMAKSANNFILVKDIIKKFDGNTLRWFMYSTKYENPLDYSLEMMQQAKNDISKLIRQVNSNYVQLYLNKYTLKKSNSINEDFINYLANDLDFPNGLKVIYELSKHSANLIRSKNWLELDQVNSQILFCLNLLGIKYENPLNDQNKKMIDSWQLALKNKDFKKADTIRNEIQLIGLI